MATVPSEITYVAGTVLTAAQLNTNLRDAVNFLIGRPAAVLRQSSAQSVSNNTYTAITMDAEDLDSDGGHSTSSNTSRYTAQTAGWFMHSGQIGWSGNSTGRRGAKWQINGADVNGCQTVGAATTASSVNVVAPNRLLFLNVGDYSELDGFQDSGGSLNTVVSNISQSSSSILWERTA